MILAIKTDQVEAKLYFASHNGRINEYKWQAHRELSNTIFEKIEDLLQDNKTKTSDITGVVVYIGPGSFTGLRIGVSVANALSYSLKVPIVGTNGSKWLNIGIKRLSKTKYHEHQTIVPEYGAEAHITKPRK